LVFSSPPQSEAVGIGADAMIAGLLLQPHGFEGLGAVGKQFQSGDLVIAQGVEDGLSLCHIDPLRLPRMPNATTTT
jgi:hypothetical protein